MMGVDSTVVNIPDPALKAAMLGEFRRPAGSDITVGEAKDLQTLTVNDGEVKDLTGLEEFTGLQHLDLADTQTSDLSPIAGLTALETLDLGSTRVTTVRDLAGLTNLRVLNLSDTSVADARPLATLTGLEELNLAGTLIADTSPVEQLATLTALTPPGTDPEDLAMLAEVFYESGVASAEDGEWREALEAYTTSTGMYRGLAKADLPRFGGALAESLCGRAGAAQVLARPFDASEAYEEAVEVLDSLHADDPAHYSQRLAEVLLVLGDFYWEHAEWAGADASFVEGFDIYTQLDEADPDFELPWLAPRRLRHWHATQKLGV